MCDIADKGFVKIICNRPNFEVPPSLSSLAMADSAAKAEIEFHTLELTHETMTPENILNRGKYSWMQVDQC